MQSLFFVNFTSFAEEKRRKIAALMSQEYKLVHVYRMIILSLPFLNLEKGEIVQDTNNLSFQPDFQELPFGILKFR